MILSVTLFFAACFVFALLFLGGFCIFFCDDITDWLEAKTDEIRARTEAMRKERANDTD